MKNLGKYSTTGLALITVGCFEPPITAGKVIAKKHEPEREYSETSYSKIGKMRIPHKHQMIDDEDFIITFGITDGDMKRERTVFVGHQTYNHFEIGDYFDCTKVNFENYDPDFRKD